MADEKRPRECLDLAKTALLIQYSCKSLATHAQILTPLLFLNIYIGLKLVNA